MALMMFLQRSPVQWIVAELRFAMGPRVVHLFKWVTGVSITSAFYNTVTGATGDLSAVGNTTAVEGANMQVAVRAERAVPVSATLEGDLPPGLISNLGDIVNAEIGSRVVPLGTIAFSGIATTPGEYPVKVTIHTWEDDSTYEGDPVFIEIDFEITLEPPEITVAPQSLQVSLGGTAELTVEVDDPENTTYQWQRNVGSNLNQFANINGATDSVYRVEDITAEANGAYRVRVTKNDINLLSDYVFLTVDESPDYDFWKSQQFDSPTSDDAQPGSNPDYDGFINAFEFLFDLDPEATDSIQTPIVSQEQIGETHYAVFSYPALIDYPNLVYAFESTSDLKNGPWTPLMHGVNGVVIITDENGTDIKIPSENATFVRVKVDTN